MLNAYRYLEEIYEEKGGVGVTTIPDRDSYCNKRWRMEVIIKYSNRNSMLI
jgi:hypothetical protein